jgi:hypothetical protein
VKGGSGFTHSYNDKAFRSNGNRFLTLLIQLFYDTYYYLTYFTQITQ